MTLTQKRRFAKFAMVGLMVIFLVIIANLVSQTTWHLMGYIPELAPEVPAQVASSPPAASNSVNLDPLYRLTPFGTIPQAITPAAEETNLKLTLHGVMLASAPTSSVAYIGVENKETERYSIGQSIIDGVILKGIHEEHIVLLVNGQPEILSFPKESEQRSIPGFGNAPVNPATPSKSTTSEVIDNYRRRIASNPQTVLDDLGLKATDQGYEITQSAGNNVKAAGFRTGDVVTSVNGEAVGNVEKDRRLFEKIAASGRARVEVLRGNSRVILSFPLQ